MYHAGELDFSHEAEFGGACIADEEEHEEHAGERDESTEDHERIEEMRAGGDARVGNVAGELEDDDGADGCAGAAESADGGDGIFVEEVGGKDVGHGGEGGVAESGDGEEDGERDEIHGEHGGDEKSATDAAEDDEGLAGASDGPAAADQVAGCGAGGEAAEVCGDEWNPNGDEAVLQRDALRDEVNREPIGDEEKNGIGEGCGR